jgi:hypothetical protein
MNTSPIYPSNGNIASVVVTGANTSSVGDGTIGTNIFKLFTSDAVDGSFVYRVRWIPIATTPTTTTATVGRVFISTVTSGVVTRADTWLFSEVTLPAIAAANASTAVIWFDVVCGFVLNPNYTLLVTNHAAPAANTFWRAVCFAGDM